MYDEYPTIITKEEGVLNEHFLVWMRLVGLPNFRKPYAKIDAALEEGTRLTVQVENNFPVNSFGGTNSFFSTLLGPILILTICDIHFGLAGEGWSRDGCGIAFSTLVLPGELELVGFDI